MVNCDQLSEEMENRKTLKSKFPDLEDFVGSEAARVHGVVVVAFGTLVRRSKVITKFLHV